MPRVQRRAALQTRCDGFLGSQVNLVSKRCSLVLQENTIRWQRQRVSRGMQIFVVSTTLFLTAGRFGLAPTVKKRATAGLQLYDTDNAGLITGDPAGAQFCSLLLCLTCCGLPCFGPPYDGLVIACHTLQRNQKTA